MAKALLPKLLYPTLYHIPCFSCPQMWMAIRIGGGGCFLKHRLLGSPTRVPDPVEPRGRGPWIFSSNKFPSDFDVAGPRTLLRGALPHLNSTLSCLAHFPYILGCIYNKPNPRDLSIPRTATPLRVFYHSYEAWRVYVNIFRNLFIYTCLAFPEKLGSSWGFGLMNV